MTDKEILYKVYEMLCPPAATREKPLASAPPSAIRDFIQQEWQRRDEGDEPACRCAAWDKLEDWREEMFNLADEGQMYNADPCTSDVKEIERRMGLELGGDGTVEEIK